MSAIITTDIFCDFCARWDESITVSGINIVRIREALKKARLRGWVRTLVAGKMLDMCPTCLSEDIEG